MFQLSAAVQNTSWMRVLDRTGQRWIESVCVGIGSRSVDLPVGGSVQTRRAALGVRRQLRE
jgi:hypothetical protein